MDRRDALKSLATLAGATGISVTPVTTTDATDAALVILKTDRKLSSQTIANLLACWTTACEGTALQHVKAIVLAEGMELEVVRRKA